MDDSEVGAGTAAGDGQSGIPFPMKVLAGLSIAPHVVLFGLYCYAVRAAGLPDLPTNRPWAWYLLVGSAWSASIGIFGLLWGAQATTRFGGYGSTARVAWCVAGVWLGFFWPIPVTAAAVVFATRRRTSSRDEADASVRRRDIAMRAAALAVAGVVAGVGPIWGLRAHAAELHPTSLTSSSVVVGTWRSSGGLEVDLHADGTYQASDLSPADFWNSDFPASTGTWDLTDDSGDSAVDLRTAPDRLLELSVYQASALVVLCAQADPDSPCDVVFRRT